MSDVQQDMRSVRNGFIAFIGSAILAAGASLFGLLSLEVAVNAILALFCLACIVISLTTPWVKGWLRIGLPIAFGLFAALFILTTYNAWRQEHPSFEVSLTIDAFGGASARYHFEVKNTGRVKAVILGTYQNSSARHLSSSISTQPRDLSGGEKITVSGDPVPGLKPDNLLVLSIVYKSHGTRRTHASRFQVPVKAEAAVAPVGWSDEETPDALSENVEARLAGRILSGPRGGFRFVAREARNGAWNYTTLQGGNKTIRFDPEKHLLNVNVKDASGVERGFFIRFLPAEVHYIYTEWNDPQEALLVGVDGEGTFAQGDNELVRVVTPTTDGLPVT